MRRDLLVYLEDVEECGRDILTFTAGKTELEYLSDLLLRRAVERSFEIMGEACRQCRLHFPGSLDTVSSVQAVIDYRNRLAHQYDDTEDETVWKIIHESLPPFVAQVRLLMNELPRA